MSLSVNEGFVTKTLEPQGVSGSECTWWRFVQIRAGEEEFRICVSILSDGTSSVALLFRAFSIQNGFHP